LTNFLKFESKFSLEKSEKAEPGCKKRTTTVSKLYEGLTLIEAGVKVFEKTD
jgi:hypothetical protein